MNEIMERVKQFKADKKERLYKIAEECGISKNTFYNYSTGRTPVRAADGEILDYYLRRQGY